MEASTLWNRNFLLWWLGTAQSSLGTALSGIAMSFLVLEQTGSAGAMGVGLALSMLPGLLSPLAGTLVDRIPLRVPLIVGNIVRGLLMIGVGLLVLAGPVPVPVLYTLSFLMGLIGVLYQPAASALAPTLVPRDQIARAMGLMGTASQTMSLVGLLLGGVLVSRVGSGPSLVADGVTFLIMATLLPFVRMPARAASQARRGFWADLGAGFARVRQSRTLTFVPVMALFINASFAPIMMLMPVRMIDLGAGAAGFALMEALITGGMALGGVLVAVLGARFRPMLAMPAGLLCVAAVMGGYALTGTLVPILALALLMGLGLAATNTSLSVLLPTLVEPEYRGRVFGLLGMVGQIGMPLSLLLLAPVADRLPIETVFAVAGVVTALAALSWIAWGREPTPKAVPATD